jgi:proteic killer suppression protein
VTHNPEDLAEARQEGRNPLKGKPQRYSIHVNGPWTLTFGWDSGEATDVDLEQYH